LIFILQKTNFLALYNASNSGLVKLAAFLRFWQKG